MRLIVALFVLETSGFFTRSSWILFHQIQLDPVGSSFSPDPVSVGSFFSPFGDLVIGGVGTVYRPFPNAKGLERREIILGDQIGSQTREHGRFGCREAWFASTGAMSVMPCPNEPLELEKKRPFI